MKAMLDTVLAPPDLEQDLFPINSRYRGTQVVTMRQDDGSHIAYLRRRFIPPPDDFATLQQHFIVEGDRLDNLAHEYLGDAELWWRLCDANGIIDPDTATAIVDDTLRVTLPPGIPGGDDA
jgi:hypothetical protein